MEIASSSLHSQSSHSLQRSEQERVSLRTWRETPPRPQPANAAPATTSAPAQESETQSLPPRLQVLKLFVERLTGRRVEVFDASELRDPSQGPAPRAAAPPDPAPTREGWGAEFEHHYRFEEHENTRFEVSGEVRTRDGRRIEVALHLDMARSFVREERLSAQFGDARLKDPLVVNFNGAAAQLGEETLAFDLDVDGENDRLRLLGPDSAYLVLDRNGDGRVNDGSELFGPTGGNGFAELAGYDDDGNGWIDAGDAAFQRLRLWHAGAPSTQRLEPLSAQGIGALSLAATATPFELRDADNRLQGVVRASALYLNEDGGAGTVQQLDLTA